MAAEARDRRNALYRKPNCVLTSATVLLSTYAVWCALLLVLTASGHLLNSQSFECGEEGLVASRLKDEALVVYIWSGLCLPFCFMLLVELWRKKGFYKVWLGLTFIPFTVMCLTVGFSRDSEIRELRQFEERYLALLPFRDRPDNSQSQLTNTACHILNNVHRWQTEFHCCGLRDYKDWQFSLPDSCLCSREDDSTGCVEVGNNLVYEKPCLPTVVSLLEKRSSVFWAIMIISMIVLGAPVATAVLFFVFAIFFLVYMEIEETCCYKLNTCIYKLRGGEEIVPVVFIKNNNNNQTDEKNRKDEESKESGVDGGEVVDSRVDCGGVVDSGVVVDVEGSTNEEGEGREAAAEEGNDNAMSFIPLSQLKRLQDELEPPPVQHQVSCMCLFKSKPKNFYIALIDEDSPLLPSGAVLADANEPRCCFWVMGPHIFIAENIIWPKERQPQGTLP